MGPGRPAPGFSKFFRSAAMPEIFPKKTRAIMAAYLQIFFGNFTVERYLLGAVIVVAVVALLLALVRRG
jgi:hypothetical protein